MRTIEILGPAGAGKTTVLGVIRDAGVAFDDHLSIGWNDRVPVLGGLLVRLLPCYLLNCSRSRWFDQEELRRLVYVRGWLRVLARRDLSEGAITIFDHGPIFMLAMLEEFGPPLVQTGQFTLLSEAAIADWSDVLDTVIWLDAPDSVLAQRVAARARQHCMKGKPLAEQSIFFNRCRCSFNRLVSLAASSGRMRVLRIDTGDGAAENIAAQILTELALKPATVETEVAFRH